MIVELAANELISVADYFEWEAEADGRHEYVGGVICATAGGTLPPAVISRNLLENVVCAVAWKEVRALRL